MYDKISIWDTSVFFFVLTNTITKKEIARYGYC
jgi:hypothetical protein